MFDNCRVYDIEKRIKISFKYLFLSFEIIYWYVVKYVLDIIKGQLIWYSRYVYSEYVYNFRYLQ